MEFKVRSEIFPDRIAVETELGGDEFPSIHQQISRQIVHMQDQAVKDGLKKLGWLSPEEAREVKKKAERYDWIKDNIEEVVYQRADEFVGTKTKYVLPFLHAYADFTGQISFDEAIDFKLEE